MQKRDEIAAAKRARGDAAFKSQMQLEEARRQRLDEEKQTVKQSAQQEVYDTLLPVAQADLASRLNRSPQHRREEEEEDVQYIPAPRAGTGGAKVEIVHSERPFPTPLRESRHSACPMLRCCLPRLASPLPHTPRSQRRKATGCRNTRNKLPQRNARPGKARGWARPPCLRGI